MEGEGANAPTEEASGLPSSEGRGGQQQVTVDGSISDSLDPCLAFFTTTMATLAVALAQVLHFQEDFDATTAFQQVVDASNWRLLRRRNNVISWVYMRIMYLVLLLFSQAGNPREIRCEWYIKPRSQQWFVMFLHDFPELDPDRFKQFFRVSPRLFVRICELVHNELIIDPPTHFRMLPNRVLVVPRQVALALCRLCTGDNFLSIAKLFGVSKSTAVKVTWRFIEALNHRVGHFIRWPFEERLRQVKEGFSNYSGFPNCCGAIDGIHFPVELPAGESSDDYFDYKHNISVSMQAIVDMDLRFLDVVAGWPGSVQDSRLLRRSRFFAAVVYRHQRLDGEPYICPNGSRIREYILGDSGYPLYDWLIVPYARGSSVANDQWNTIHSSTRMCVERAFRRLKGTWRILSRVLFKPKMERIGPMIYACCVLHNIIIDSNDGLNPTIYEGVRAHPHGYGQFAVPNQGRFDGGVQARNVIRQESNRLRAL